MGISSVTWQIDPVTFTDGSGNLRNSGPTVMKNFVAAFVENTDFVIDEVVTDTTSPTSYTGEYDVYLKHKDYPDYLLRFRQQGTSNNGSCGVYKRINGTRNAISWQDYLYGPYNYTTTSQSAIYRWVYINDFYGVLFSNYGGNVYYSLFCARVSNSQSQHSDYIGRAATQGNLNWYELPYYWSVGTGASKYLTENAWTRTTEQAVSFVQTVYTGATPQDDPFWVDTFAGSTLWKSAYALTPGTLYSIGAKQYFALTKSLALEIT